MSTAVLQFHRRESFERNVGRALLAGAVAGGVQLALDSLGWRLPLAYLALAATCVAFARGDRADRLLLSALGLIVPAVVWGMGFAAGWTVALGGAAAGLLMVRANQCERGEEGQLGVDRPGAVNYAFGASVTAGLALAGVEVVRVLSLRLADISTPAPLSALATGAALALFIALGSLPAHVALRPDPVEARCEELIPQLSGEFRLLASRALALYRQCGSALARLPRDPAREELARTLADMTRAAVELASEWAGVEHELEERAQKELNLEIADLEKSARACADALARQQLLSAAESLREELVRVEELRLRRERILARLKAEVALLERARVALIGLRSGQAQIRATELAAIARRFASLSRLQSEEARLADEVATGAAIAEYEAAAFQPDGERAGPVREHIELARQAENAQRLD
ncbi:MAG TPA: hypothetical protein VE782_14835, partial [Myxococcaceae bacterium]|nr:hypothetical protein [Myxococcaceae bacterium]